MRKSTAWNILETVRSHIFALSIVDHPEDNRATLLPISDVGKSLNKQRLQEDIDSSARKGFSREFAISRSSSRKSHLASSEPRQGGKRPISLGGEGRLAGTGKIFFAIGTPDTRRGHVFEMHHIPIEHVQHPLLINQHSNSRTQATPTRAPGYGMPCDVPLLFTPGEDYALMRR